MPFQSEKQRRYLHANHPEIAKRWEKEYSNGGILDIDGSEEITTEEGNDISLVDESEIGVSTLFRAKNGGNATKNIKGQPHMLAYITPGEAKTLENLGGQKTMPKEGIPAYPPSDNYGGNWGGSSSGSTTSGGGSTNRERGIVDYHSRLNEISKEKQRQEDLKNLVETGPGSVEEKYETWDQQFQDIPGTLQTNKYKNQVRVNKAREDWNKVKDSMDEKYKQKVGKKIIGGLLSGGVSFGIGDIIGMMIDGYKTNKAKQEFIGVINETIENYKGLGMAQFHHAVDTPIQTLEQELLDLTQTRDKDEDTGDDGPIAPVVRRVTEEIEDSYAMAGNWLQSYRDLKAKQALSASLQEKWADEREWQQNTMFANRGGLANLFRVKN